MSLYRIETTTGLHIVLAPDRSTAIQLCQARFTTLSLDDILDIEAWPVSRALWAGFVPRGV